MDNKEKFAHNFMDFIRTLAFDIPKVFFDNDPFFKAMRRARINNHKIKRGLYNLQYRGFIKNEKTGYSITEKGKQWVKTSKYKFFRFRHATWDGKWRIIMFDIPSIMEHQRQSLRYRLKRVGAYMVQKSVFVFPYPCEVEIGDWCQELGIGEYVDVITADHIGSKENFAKKYFGL